MNIWRIREKMVDTGVNQSSWNTITRGVSTSTTGIGKLSDMGFSHTDLTPFTTFNDVLEHFNKSIVNLKKFTRSDALKMEQAGQNKLDDDAHGAGVIASGGLRP